MEVSLPLSLYGPVYDFWARPVTINPLVSQPTAASYAARGCLDTREVDVVAEDGSVFSDAKTELRIRQIEFAIMPMQGDTVDIPIDQEVDGGSFEIVELLGWGNAGGEITMILKRIVTAKPTRQDAGLP